MEIANGSATPPISSPKRTSIRNVCYVRLENCLKLPTNSENWRNLPKVRLNYKRPRGRRAAEECSCSCSCSVRVRVTPCGVCCFLSPRIGLYKRYICNIVTLLHVNYPASYAFTRTTNTRATPSRIIRIAMNLISILRTHVVWGATNLFCNAFHSAAASVGY